MGNAYWVKGRKLGAWNLPISAPLDLSAFPNWGGFH